MNILVYPCVLINLPFATTDHLKLVNDKPPMTYKTLDVTDSENIKRNLPSTNSNNQIHGTMPVRGRLYLKSMFLYLTL